LIWRGPDRVHFGDHPVPITLSVPEASWLSSLSNHRTWQQASRACPTGPARAEQIIGQARAARALDEPGECWWLTPDARAASRPEFLALAHWHADPAQAIAARSGCAIAVHGEPALRDVLLGLVNQCALRTVEPRYADVVVLVAHGHIDAIEAHDEHTSIPHLPIRIHHARAAIGPLVVPGRTPCCRCLALHARDRDSAWPAMAAQWRSHTSATPASAGPDRLLVQRAAVEAVAMVREWIDTADHPSGQRVHLELPRMIAQDEHITPHEACGCLWQHGKQVA